MYNEAEFALILREATDLANPNETHGHPSGGLTLAEMKAAASEVGIDPALVERAARLLPANLKRKLSASPHNRRKAARPSPSTSTVAAHWLSSRW